MTGAVPAHALARVTTILGPEFSREDVKRLAPRLLPHIDNEPAALRVQARAVLNGIDPFDVKADEGDAATYLSKDGGRFAVYANDVVRHPGRTLFRTFVALDGAPAAFQAMVEDDARLGAVVHEVMSTMALLPFHPTLLAIKSRPAFRAPEHKETLFQAMAIAAVAARATACALVAPVAAGGREGAKETNAKRSDAASAEEDAILAAWVEPEMRRLPSDRARCARLKVKHGWSRAKIMRVVGAKQPPGK